MKIISWAIRTRIFCISWCFTFLKLDRLLKSYGSSKLRQASFPVPIWLVSEPATAPTPRPWRPCAADCSTRALCPQARRTPPGRAGAGRGLWARNPPLRRRSWAPSGRAGPEEGPAAVAPPGPARPSPDRYLSGSSTAPDPVRYLPRLLACRGR